MHPEESSLTTKSDITRINALLRRLCLPRWLGRTGILVAVLLAWIWVANQILIGGSLVNYSGLRSLGTQVVDFLTRINPYLWWGLTIILSLIVLSLARSWLKASINKGRQVPISVGDVQKLSQAMTTEGVEVLLWAWDHESGPVTIGDLIVARDQLRSGRVRKLATARAQHQVLLQARDAESGMPSSPNVASKPQ